ncbi:hypothetical protein [Pseudoflavonifractor phocaeensis]|uniref:hypothetical protein n=1 Tax=Pseudoflavonifractor phocaeensis TaxID=1870988 RepID=UPI00195B2A61|nr:hypothetical protein [Pseudoflavonifractor phocaeensis]MBM6888198.1 hypothetical protein [Pseudoflavonifractor phocaeensis]
MEKKHLGKTVLLIALSATLLGGTLPAQAAEIHPNEVTAIQPREIGVAIMNCRLSISSGGNASCFGDVSMSAGYDSEITLALQRSTNGRTWSNVASWSGSGSETLTKSRFVTSGYDYRCKLTVKVYNSSGEYVITYSQYSDTISY